jgi:hypothetical protein
MACLRFFFSAFPSTAWANQIVNEVPDRAVHPIAHARVCVGSSSSLILEYCAALLLPSTGQAAIRFINGVVTTVAIAITLGILCPTAWAQGVIVKTDQITLENAQADFGSGFHVFGRPLGGGSITWNYSTAGGSLVARATVKGTLYVDTANTLPNTPYGARLLIYFENAAGTELGFRNKDLCCILPTTNANDAQNQLAINESFVSSELASVFVGVVVLIRSREQGRPWYSMAIAMGAGHPSASASSAAPVNKKHDVRFNNGNNDFGGDTHLVGSPITSGLLQLTRNGGSVTARVKGTLYWDTLFGNGCTRLIIDFQDLNGTNIRQKMIDRCGSGGNANDSANKLSVDESFTSGSLMKVRLRVGTLQDGNFRNVETRAYGWN